MRIYSSPFVIMDGRKAPVLQMAPACRTGNVSACAKFPRGHVLLPHHGLVDAITPDQFLPVIVAARLLRSDGGAMGTSGTYPSFELTGSSS
jgi:hypothetical protein